MVATDAALLVQQQEVESHGSYAGVGRAHHVPVEAHAAMMAVNRASADEPEAAGADELIMGFGDSGVNQGMSMGASERLKCAPTSAHSSEMSRRRLSGSHSFHSAT